MGVDKVTEAKKATGKLIGYARVSTEDQELRLQRDALQKVGAWNIYEEKASATRGKRPQLELALLDLRPGDTLIVWRIDRLARNVRELYALVDRVYAQGANFRSLTEQFDFQSAFGEFALGVLALCAQLETRITAARTKAGMAALKARGMMLGAKPKLTPAQAAKLVKLRKTLTVAELSRRFNVSPATVNNYVNRAKIKPNVKLRAAAKAHREIYKR